MTTDELKKLQATSESWISGQKKKANDRLVNIQKIVDSRGAAQGLSLSLGDVVGSAVSAVSDYVKG